MRHRRISPFCLYEALSWGNRHREKSVRPEARTKDEIRLGSESAVNGAGHHLLITAGNSAIGWVTPEFEVQMQEREVYGGTRLDATMRLNMDV